MKKIIIYIVLICSSFKLFAGEEGTKGIQFRNITFEKALETSKKEGKPVFMHGFASWCHYCSYMVESVYPDSAVGAFYNEHFISIKVDLEKEGAELNKQLKVHTFPTFVFFDANGDVIHRAAGRYYKQLFLELANEATTPRRQLRSWMNIYNEGNVSADTAYQVIRKMEVAGMETQEALLKYLNHLSSEQIILPENWRIINEVFKDVNSGFMQKLIVNKKALEQQYTASVVNSKFISIYSFEFYMRNRQLDSLGYDKLKQKIKESKLDIGNMICEYADLNRMNAMSMYDDYFKTAPDFINAYGLNNAAMINEISQVYYDKTQDPVLLLNASAWMNRSVQLDDSYNSNMLLCGILIQLKNKKEAMIVANHAKEIAEKNKLNNRSLLLLLDKIEAMQ